MNTKFESLMYRKYRKIGNYSRISKNATASIQKRIVYKNTPVYYDSTAGVCTACGLLEIAKYVSDEEAKYYTKEAINILKACDEHFCNYEENEDALVLMGSERYPHSEEAMKGVHIPLIYGDFFFVEALCKLKGREFLIW